MEENVVFDLDLKSGMTYDKYYFKILQAWPNRSQSAFELNDAREYTVDFLRMHLVSGQYCSIRSHYLSHDAVL